MSSMPERIQKLLDKAGSEATPEGEREALLARASEMMATYNIDAAMLSAAAQVFTSPSSELFYVVNPFSVPKVSLLAHIAKSFSCKAIIEKNAAKNSGVAEIRVFGFENEILATQTIFVSALLVGMMKSEARRREGNTSRGYHSSYWTGFAVGVGEQLNAATETATKTAENANAGTSIVLRDRSLAVNKLVNETYPRFRTIRRTYSNGGGFRDGKTDGANANLRSNNGVGSGRRSISS